MSTLLAALAGALVVGGVLLGIYALTPRPAPPPRPARPARTGRLIRWWRGLPAWQRWSSLAALAIGVLVMVADWLGGRRPGPPGRGAGSARAVDGVQR